MGLRSISLVFNWRVALDDCQSQLWSSPPFSSLLSTTKLLSALLSPAGEDGAVISITAYMMGGRDLRQVE